MYAPCHNDNYCSLEPDFAIRVKNGTAILTGTVASRAEKIQAEEAVYAMRHVAQVHNLMKTCSD